MVESMIRITVALKRWSRISFYLSAGDEEAVAAGRSRRCEKHRCFIRSGRLNEDHQATL